MTRYSKDDTNVSQLCSCSSLNYYSRRLTFNYWLCMSYMTISHRGHATVAIKINTYIHTWDTSSYWATLSGSIRLPNMARLVTDSLRMDQIRTERKKCTLSTYAQWRDWSESSVGRTDQSRHWAYHLWFCCLITDHATEPTLSEWLGN